MSVRLVLALVLLLLALVCVGVLLRYGYLRWVRRETGLNATVRTAESVTVVLRRAVPPDTPPDTPPSPRHSRSARHPHHPSGEHRS